MGLFGGDSKSIKRVTNITRTDVDSETVTGVKATGESVVTQAGGDIGLTGARFERVATGLTSALTQGTQAIAAGAQTAQRESTERLNDARQITRAAAGSGSTVSAADSAGGAGGVEVGTVAIAAAAALAIGIIVWVGSR